MDLLWLCSFLLLQTTQRIFSDITLHVSSGYVPEADDFIKGHATFCDFDRRMAQRTSKEASNSLCPQQHCLSLPLLTQDIIKPVDFPKGDFF